MTNNNYTRDGVDSATAQKKVTTHHDFNGILFDNTNPDHLVPASEEGYSQAIDVWADPDFTLFIDCVNAFTFYIQVTDDTADNPDWYSLYNISGTLVSFAVTNDKKAFPVSVKAKQMRIVASNGGIASEAPYVGVI